jgi:pyrrolidone-carboxylate peptidase
MESARFGRRRENVKRILISGFDPFQLDVSRIGGDIRRGNPSGAAILALDGQRITGDGVSAEIQGVIFPVRFADFDAGRVEAFFRPYLSPEPSVDMIMTISMGGGPSFEVEEFAGRRRSGGLDNLGRSTTASGEPPGLGAGPEFIRTTLPVGTIRKGLGRTEPLPGETEIIEIPAGSRRQIRVERGGPSPGSTAVRGSGGGYLSNEIFYRTSLLRLETGADIPVGHLHTPLLLPPAGTGISSQQFEGSRNQIVRQILDIIRSTLPAL